MHDINVIGTLQLLAACERSPSHRRDRRPRLRRHLRLGARRPAVLHRGHGAPLSAAHALPARRRGDRELLRDLRAPPPDVICTMLRYQPAIGPALTPRSRATCRCPLAPTYLGFDPRLQFVHEEDGLDALVAAVKNPVRGAVNVAAQGTIGLTRMIRMARQAVAAGARPAVRRGDRRHAPRRAARLLARLPAAAALRPRRGHDAAGRGGRLHAALHARAAAVRGLRGRRHGPRCARWR